MRINVWGMNNTTTASPYACDQASTTFVVTFQIARLNMPLELKNLHVVDDTSFDYIFERNVDVPLKSSTPNIVDDPLLVRVNVYRPKTQGQFPVIVTYGPYGKDIPYHQFHAQSWADVNPKQKSAHSAWEVPDPLYWTSNNYVVVRADERGSGDSPGKLDSMSSTTCDGFVDVIEWSAEQPWSNGKVGLLGISYFAGSQWRAAARKPKGLACIVPWEGMSDYYRDRVRHGGILSNEFIKYWFDRQVGSNQYGLGGRTERGWGTDSLEGVLSAEELASNRADQPIDTAVNQYRDDEYFRSRDFDLADIEVPVLSAANWGGIHLHLRGNVMGFMKVGSKFKYLRFLTGRHDIPFFYDEEVAIQRSFLDACLKGNDIEGWLTPGKVAPVSLCMRKGNPGYNKPEAERATYPRREEWEWPIARTQYTDYHLVAGGTLHSQRPETASTVEYDPLHGSVRFRTPAAEHEIEVTGHPVARLSVSMSERDGSKPSEIDLFVTLRHYDSEGKEIFYTGAVGDPVPVVRGWLRVSLRKTTSKPTPLSKIIPERDYLSTDVQSVEMNKIYTVDVELWPTSVVVLPRETLELEVSGCDSEGVSVFGHDHSDDRADAKLKGINRLHIGPEMDNYLRLPMIPT